MVASAHYLCYFAVLFICIDQGQGRWKMTPREKLEYDIETFKRMSEKIKKEIEEFYMKNPDITKKKDYLSNIKRMNEEHRNGNKEKHSGIALKTESVNSIPSLHNLTVDRQTSIKEIHGNYKSDSKREEQDIFLQGNDIKSENISNRTENHWPKFNDILLAMGKMYDWKNDRWIKVKEKNKQLTTASSVIDNRLAFLSKHKFAYRSVKLNKSKTKRKLVIAVSAIR